MPDLVRAYAELSSQEASIANGASLSGAVVLPPAEYLCGISMPAAWTAANLTFQASFDGTTYYDLYDQDGTELNITAAASRHIVLNPDNFWGFKWLKVRSGTTGTPVNQGAARTITLLTRAL